MRIALKSPPFALSGILLHFVSFVAPVLRSLGRNTMLSSGFQ